MVWGCVAFFPLAMNVEQFCPPANPTIFPIYNVNIARLALKHCFSRFFFSRTFFFTRESSPGKMSLEIPIACASGDANLEAFRIHYYCGDAPPVVVEQQKVLLRGAGFVLETEIHTSGWDGCTTTLQYCGRLHVLVTSQNEGAGSVVVVTSAASPISPKEAVAEASSPLPSARREREEDEASTEGRRKAARTRRNILLKDTTDDDDESMSVPVAVEAIARFAALQNPVYPSNANPAKKPCSGCHGQRRHGLDFYAGSTSTTTGPLLILKQTCIRHFPQYCRKHHKDGCPNPDRCQLGNRLHQMAIDREAENKRKE